MKLINQGILPCLFSQFLFGVLYLFSLWLQPLNGINIFVWRMITMPFTLAFFIFPTIGYRSLQRLIQENLGKNRSRWVIFLLGTANAGSQFWLFMWAPVNGEGSILRWGIFYFHW